MEIVLEDFLSARIIKHCLPLFRDGYYGEAAHKAMTLVELALKEKGGVKDGVFGVRMVRRLLGPGRSIKLKVPLAEDLQEYAAALFEGAFAYYRNYAAHDGSKIDKTISLRVLILASELLDLIDASDLSYADLGGIEGLLQEGIFERPDELAQLLKFLMNRYMPAGNASGFFESLYLKGFTDAQYHAVLELGFVRFFEREVPIPPEMRTPPYFDDTETLWGHELTNLGEETLAAVRENDQPQTP